MFPAFTEMSRVELTLYTDSLITRGWVRTRQHRVTDILNLAEQPFLILEDVTVEEMGDRGQPIRADIAQINLESVLFAVADVPVEPSPELRTPKVAAEAIVSVPPFRITGTIHLLQGEMSLREALSELTGAVHPGHERDLLVGPAGRGAPVGAPGGGQPSPHADPGPAPGGRPVGRPRRARPRRRPRRVRGRPLG